MYKYHKPVLLDELIENIPFKKNDIVIDCTFGFGGHSKEILKIIGKKGLLLGLDQNIPTIKIMQDEMANEFSDYDWHLRYGNFRNLNKILTRIEFNDKPNVIIFDLGISSYQIDKANLGISFQRAEPLDMRLSKSDSKLTAEFLVNKWSEKDLANIFFEYGEERFSRRIAKKIIEYRKNKYIEDSLELAEIVKSAIPKRFWHLKRHPATKTFQAIRIAVNDELNALRNALPQALEVLDVKGYLGIITFHSLEDKIVKDFLEKKAVIVYVLKNFLNAYVIIKKV